MVRQKQGLMAIIAWVGLCGASHANAQVTVSALGKMTITADQNAESGNGVFSSLSALPILREEEGGELATGTEIVITAPDGFEFDTGTDVGAQPWNGSDIDLGDGPGVLVYVTPTAETITFTVAAGSTVPGGKIRFGYIKLRPLNCAEAAVDSVAITVAAGDALEDEDFVDVKVVPGQPATLALGTVGAQVAGSPFSVPITVRDSCELDVPGAYVTLSTDTGEVEPTGTVTGKMPAVDGVRYQKAETGVRLRARVQGLQTITNAFDVVPNNPARLAIDAVEGPGPANEVFVNAPFAVTVSVRDLYYNVTEVTADTMVSLRLPGVVPGTLSGNTVGVIDAGTSTKVIEGVLYDYVIDRLVLLAHHSLLSQGASDPFDVLQAGEAVELGFAAIGPKVKDLPFNVTVNFLDDLGLPTTVSAATEVTLSRNTGTGDLAGTLTMTAAAGSGSVVFSGLTYNKVENGVKLKATATGLTQAVSDAFNVQAQSVAPTKLEIAAIPDQVVAEAFAVTVTATDDDGNPIAVNANQTVTLTRHVGTGTLGGTLTGTMSAGASSVTIEGVTYGKAEAGVKLRAAAAPAGLVGTSNAFVVADPPVPPTPTKLVIATIGEQQAGEPFSVTVTATDGEGTPIAVDANQTVTLTRQVGTGTLGGTLTGSMPAGESSVTIEGVTYSKGEEGVKIRAAATPAGLTGLSDAFVVMAQPTPPTPTKLVVASIGEQVTGEPFSVTVTATDNDGTAIAVAATQTVILERIAGTGVLGGTLTGTMTAGTSGVTIDGVTYSKGETGVTIRATATPAGLTGTSGAFEVVDPPAPPAPSRLVVSAIAEQVVGELFAVTVTATDGDGEPAVFSVAQTINLTRDIGTGSLGGIVFALLPAGQSQVTFNNLTYDKAEAAVRIRAVAAPSGLAGVSNVFTVTAAPTPPPVCFAASPMMLAATVMGLLGLKLMGRRRRNA